MTINCPTVPLKLHRKRERYARQLSSALSGRNSKARLPTKCDSHMRGGPDWSVKRMINFAFGMIWQKLRLDCHILCCYAPEHSRFNPIKRSWAALTKWMTGVTLPHSIKENDFEEPKENEHEKWEVVLNNAMEQCARFWNGRRFDGFGVKVKNLLSNDPRIPKKRRTTNFCAGSPTLGNKK